MIRKFLDWSIRRKLSIIVLTISGVLITLIATMLTVERYVSFRQNILETTSALAEVVGINSTAALAFQDPETGEETLSALRVQEDIIVACLFNGEGEVFATYVNAYSPEGIPEAQLGCTFEGFKEAALAEQMSRFGTKTFELIKPVYLNDKIVGHVAIRTDLQSIQKRLAGFVFVMFSIGVLLFVITQLVCKKLDFTIVGPITELVDAMNRISDTQDYTLRVKKEYSDEIGMLVDGFNEMLGQIQRRDFQIAEHQQQLEELVKVRTRELEASNLSLIQEAEEKRIAESQLAHAQKMKAIGTLAGGVAHDLNNILSGIVTYPELLLMDLPDDSKLRLPLETIQTSGKKATAIVQDLLTLARRGIKVEENVDLRKLVEDYIRSPECKELITNHPGVELEVRVQHDFPVVTGSYFHLLKTIMNLVSNAAEAITENGVVRIEVDQIRLDSSPPGMVVSNWKKGEYVVLSISDNGIGIPSQYQGRIFEPFYSKKEMGRSGTGLGMAVVWGAVEDHGGHISLESKVDVGTVFNIYLPSSTDPVPSDKKEVTNQLFYGKGERILVVDDSTEQREIACATFSRLGYAVDSVGSGEEAIEFLGREDVDLVVLDMIMPPGMDGLDTYRAILTFKKDQKVIIASGFAKSNKVRVARDLGVRAYVRKPYSIDKISRTIQKVLK